MLQTIMDISRRAGDMARRHAGNLNRDDVHHKSAVDMVTRIDHELEDFLRTELERAFPGTTFFGEEGTYGCLADHDRVFVVDPLDGTTSFIHGHPFYSISIGYRVAGKPRIGVVHLPAFGETYWAVAGEGAWHDGNRLHVSTTTTLINSLAATGFACVRARRKPDGLPLFCDLIYRIRGIRRCGSAAIDLCYVAQGRYDLYWELNLQPWDTAAGFLIVSEAGGRITDFDGGTDVDTAPHMVASNGLVHDEFLAVASRHPHLQDNAGGSPS